jgi:hypothetical protein
VPTRTSQVRIFYVIANETCETFFGSRLFATFRIIKPGVNSRVSSVSEWIDSVVCELSIDPPSDFCPERTDARSWHLMLMVVGIIAVTMAFFALCDCRAKKSLGVGDLDKSDTLIEKELLCNTYASRSEGESYGSIEAIALTTD